MRMRNRVEMSRRVWPNVLITGTPSTGKSALCHRLVKHLNRYKHYNVSEFARHNNCIESFDEKFNCHVIDDDRLVQQLEKELSPRGATILDYHSADLFPKQWIDAVFVLRCNNTILYDRLTERRYSKEKIESNLQCEIFQTLYDEARDAFGDDIVVQLNSDNQNDLKTNVKTIRRFIRQWKANNNNE